MNQWVTAEVGCELLFTGYTLENLKNGPRASNRFSKAPKLKSYYEICQNTLNASKMMKFVKDFNIFRFFRDL